MPDTFYKSPHQMFKAAIDVQIACVSRVVNRLNRCVRLMAALKGNALPDSGFIARIGQNVSAGVGQGASQYDFSGDAGMIASALEGALIAAIGEGTFNNVGTSAMSGLSLAMSGYSFSGTGSTVASSVQSAMGASPIEDDDD